MKKKTMNVYDTTYGFLFGPWTRVVRAALAVLAISMAWERAQKPIREFIDHSDGVAQGMSSPQIMFKTRLQDGTELIVDDYYKGYQWLDKNTHADARVLAWWDYGYQITGIGNRTSIADGNTWNHEHIATLGRALVSPEKRAWNIIRHIADYVLIWAGQGGDDLGKSIHMARISSSVFDDVCGKKDPTCKKFGFTQTGPTEMMEKSLLYKLSGHGRQPGVRAHPKLFQEVHTTKYGMMRIFKVMNISEESRDWIADPSNRKCDAPGSWYCPGDYPPALKPLIQKRRSFAQVEDFNTKGKKNAYTEYIEKSGGVI